jgi:hypothetical protein
MKSTRSNSKRVLAIDPTTRGFGFVVLESPTTLVDWGVKVIRQQNEGKTLGKISELIGHYLPNLIVLEDYRGSRRCARIERLLDGVHRLATTKGLKTRRILIARVKKVFRTFQANTKYERAHTIAQQLPELAPRLPRYRKPWMSEDYRMAIFDAAALALTYFHSRPLLSRDVPKESLTRAKLALASDKM